MQYGIDNKTDDTQALFEQSLYGGTRFSKTLKQSVYLKNVFAIDYLTMDIVPKNNNNVNYAKYKDEENAVDEESSFEAYGMDSYDEITLPGALVGDPMLNSHTGITILGHKSMFFFADTIDFDFSSMYPYVKITTNNAPHTQYGRIIITKQLIDNENPDDNPKFIRGGKLIEDYESDDTSNVARWIGIKPVCDYMNDYSKWRLNNE